MAGRIRALVSFAQAVAAGAAVVWVSVLPAGQAQAAAAARPSDGVIEALSCTSAGECAAAGFLGRDQPMVVSEKNGVWGSARAVGGLSALPGGEADAELGTVSCSSAGNCGAGGFYEEPPSFDTHDQGLVVTERRGVWGKAMAVRGLAALNTGKYAAVSLMSCRSAGNCTAAGNYLTRHGDARGFVVSEKDGTWGKAEPVRGLAAPDPFVSDLSCGSPGNCTIVGSYDTGPGTEEAFTATQTDGTWSPAQTFPAIAALSSVAGIDTLACWPDGDCTGTGSYGAEGGSQHLFAISRTGATWGAPAPIPGSAALGYTNSPILSCPSPGNCTLGGGYLGRGGDRSFVASEKNGTWGRARPLPIAALHVGEHLFLNGLVCFSAGTCTAAGSYLIQHSHYTVAAVFVTAEKNGTWGKPLRLPGSLVNLGTNVELNALSCGAPGDCTAGGTYGTGQSFVVTQKHGIWGKARPLRSIRP